MHVKFDLIQVHIHDIQIMDSTFHDPETLLHHWSPILSLNPYSASRDNWCTVGGDGGCRVGEVRAGTTSPMPDHKGFKLQQLVNFQKFSTLRVKRWALPWCTWVEIPFALTCNHTSSTWTRLVPTGNFWAEVRNWIILQKHKNEPVYLSTSKMTCPR